MSEATLDTPLTMINPVEPFLRMDRMPHIWCPACGIGTTVNCFARALESSKLNLNKVAIVSGIGCTGRVAGYANLDSFHTTHGRAIPFATGLKLSNPELQVVVYSGDGDLFAIGGNHFIHAARRNMDIKVICVNNLTYAMTGGQTGPATPTEVISATSPYGVFEPSFNLVQLAEAAGASYVPRWTTYHVKQLSRSTSRFSLESGLPALSTLRRISRVIRRILMAGVQQDGDERARRSSAGSLPPPPARCCCRAVRTSPAARRSRSRHDDRLVGFVVRRGPAGIHCRLAQTA